MEATNQHSTHFSTQILDAIGASGPGSGDKPVKKVNTDILQVGLYQSLHLVAGMLFATDKSYLKQNSKAAVGKLPKRAGATPLFRLSAAQKVRGVAPALGRRLRCRQFSDLDRRSDQFTSKEKPMPIIKKAPAILTREVRMEEPVSALLDDYAQFIESSADHVVNSVLKKTLWRDQDYRKWRELRKARNDGPAKTQPERLEKS